MARLTEQALEGIKARIAKNAKVIAAPQQEKYGNKRFTDKDGVWHSRREWARWQQLRLLEASGEISALRRQVPFVLAPGAVIQGRKRPPIRFVADFVYLEGEVEVIEDTKGYPTRVYLMKRHLMFTVLGKTIKET